MKIIRGFTLIELLVVMGIIAILAVMAAPNFLQMQNKVKFREDAQKFLDILGEARSNALSNKKCDNGETSLKWSVYFREAGNQFKLYCQWDDTSATYLAAEQNNEVNFSLASISKIHLVEDEGATASSTYSFNNAAQGFVLISYLSGTSQMKIESFGENGETAIPTPVLTNLNGNRQNDIRVIFAWERTDENEKIIVCMNSVAGFPRIQYGNDSLLNCPAE